MLRTVQFTNNLGQQLSVAFEIFSRNKCVFTALDSSNQGSSINYAEAIITAICGAVQINPLDMRWYDLQTRRSYGKSGKPKPGDFEFDEVLLSRSELHRCGFNATSWNPTKCPTEIVTAFSTLIDGVPGQVNKPALAIF